MAWPVFRINRIGPLLGALAAAAFLSDCGKTLPSNTRAWFVESYENGVVTVKHNGNIYKATCEVRGAYSVEHRNDVESADCEMPTRLVGREVQPYEGTFEGMHRNADGLVVVMWDSGNALMLRSYRTDQAWTHERFKITSVTNVSH
jgi:hypothetical protein